MIRKIIYTLFLSFMTSMMAYGEQYEIKDNNGQKYFEIEQEAGKYLYYTIDLGAKTATLSHKPNDQNYYGNSLNGAISIPYEIEDNNGIKYQVIFNQGQIFNNGKFSSVYVDCENIPSYAFYNTQLNSIVFGKHVKTIGDYAFQLTHENVKSITFEGSIASLPKDMLSGTDGNNLSIAFTFKEEPLPELPKGFFDFMNTNTNTINITLPEGCTSVPQSWADAAEGVKNMPSGGITGTIKGGGDITVGGGGSTPGGGENPGGGGGGSGETDPDAGITPTPRDYTGDNKVIDTNPSTFPNVSEGTLEKGSVEYKRTFTNSTDWQATYLPFTMNYDDWKDQLRVSKLMNIHRYDGDGDGINESWILEIKEIKSGNTIANQPYVLRPKNEGDNQEITITTSNSIIYPRRTNKKLTCWSTEVEYTFEGVVENYNDWATARSDGSELFIVNSGELRKIPSGSTSKLRAFRWYMKMKSKDNSYQMADGGVSSIRNVRLKVIGEDLEDNTTDIVTTDTTTPTPVEYYNVNGTRLDSPTSGINIVKMNDGSIKKLFIKR